MGSTKSWILTDVVKRIWLDDFELKPTDLGMPEVPAWSVRKCTLHGGLSDGVDIIEINNGDLSFSILPTRGMGIWLGKYKSLTLGWGSPVQGPVHPKYVNLQDRGGLGWLAGFDEMIVRCGLDSHGPPSKDTIINNMGIRTDVPLTLHGRIANLPASRVEIQIMPKDPTEIMVIGEVFESGLFTPQFRLITKTTTKCASNYFTITDEILNMKNVEAEMELLYHCNFGPPFLEEGSRLEIPSLLVAPRDARAAEDSDTYKVYSGPTPGYVEQVYWFDPLSSPDGQTLAMLQNSNADKAVVVRFDKRELPTFTQWKNTGALSDGYVTGLEPGTDYPNSKTFERNQGRLVKMGPGQRYWATITIEVHDTKSGIEKTRNEIAEIQKTASCTVHKDPLPTLSPLD